MPRKPPIVFPQEQRLLSALGERLRPCPQATQIEQCRRRATRRDFKDDLVQGRSRKRWGPTFGSWPRWVLRTTSINWELTIELGGNCKIWSLNQLPSAARPPMSRRSNPRQTQTTRNRHDRGQIRFHYERDWLRDPRAFALDPDLSLDEHPFFPKPELGNFGIFLDSSPYRWGQTLMKRREALQAKDEKRPSRTLYAWDFLIGVQDLTLDRQIPRQG